MLNTFGKAIQIKVQRIFFHFIQAATLACSGDVLDGLDSGLQKQTTNETHDIKVNCYLKHKLPILNIKK